MKQITRKQKHNPKLIPMHKHVYRYNMSGELIGIQGVNDWQDDEITLLIQAIQKRGDGSWASMKEINTKTKRAECKNEAHHKNEAD